MGASAKRNHPGPHKHRRRTSCAGVVLSFCRRTRGSLSSNSENAMTTGFLYDKYMLLDCLGAPFFISSAPDEAPRTPSPSTVFDMANNLSLSLSLSIYLSLSLSLSLSICLSLFIYSKETVRFGSVLNSSGSCGQRFVSVLELLCAVRFGSVPGILLKSPVRFGSVR